MPPVTANPLSGIDHTLIGVRDLEAARDAWRRLGFTVTPRGRHIGWGTGNYCIMFRDDYVELLGIVDPAQFLNRLDTLLETRGEGLLGLAFAAASSSDVHAAFPDITQPPKDLGRLLELPEGDVTPRFSLVHFNPEATPGLATFSCTHLTPEMLRRPEWLDHPNGAIGLDGVTVAAADPDRLGAGLCGAVRRLGGPERAGQAGGEGRTAHAALPLPRPAVPPVSRPLAGHRS